VREEYKAGRRREPEIIDSVFETVDVDVDQRLLPYFHFQTTSGEITVISYALRDPNAFCVIDEEFGRQICRFFELPLTGSVGIIKQLQT
jgi:predicted nucleic acid-binding protein